ncbi:MAG: neocarzinostatin apoprotein domain-containing protein [Acidimicrobiales bacterium]
MLPEPLLSVSVGTRLVVRVPPSYEDATDIVLSDPTVLHQLCTALLSDRGRIAVMQALTPGQTHLGATITPPTEAMMPAWGGEIVVTAGRSTTPVESGFGGQEYFCAQPPLTGDTEYDGTSGQATMHLAVGGLPPTSWVALDWVNNPVRGYTIGSFTTDATGRSVQTSLTLVRPGEVRGYQLVLTAAGGAQTLGILWPCGPPPRTAGAIVDDPTVTMAPDAGLHDGQVVRVAVTGMGAGAKVRLSECAHVEDANQLGCGPQPAAQPFIVTDSQGSGSSAFAVRSSAPTKPLDTADREPCTRLCVVIARGEGGAWVVAPITFATAA